MVHIFWWERSSFRFNLDWFFRWIFRLSFFALFNPFHHELYVHLFFQFFVIWQIDLKSLVELIVWVFSLNKVADGWDRVIRLIFNLHVLKPLELFYFVLSVVKFNKIFIRVSLVFLFLSLRQLTPVNDARHALLYIWWTDLRFTCWRILDWLGIFLHRFVLLSLFNLSLELLWRWRQLIRWDLLGMHNRIQSRNHFGEGVLQDFLVIDECFSLHFDQAFKLIKEFKHHLHLIIRLRGMYVGRLLIIVRIIGVGLWGPRRLYRSWNIVVRVVILLVLKTFDQNRFNWGLNFPFFWLLVTWRGYWIFYPLRIVNVGIAVSWLLCFWFGFISFVVLFLP